MFYILQKRTQLLALQWELLSILQWVGCLPSTKSTHHNLRCCTTYLLLCDECLPMADPPAQSCITNCAKYSYVLLFIVQCTLCRRGLCAVCDEEYNCFITRPRLPILSLHQHVQLQVQMFVHVQLPAQWKPS